MAREAQIQISDRRLAPPLDRNRHEEPVRLTRVEMECYPTLRAKGQVTIPEEVRETLDLDVGERVKLTVETLDDG